MNKFCIALFVIVSFSRCAFHRYIGESTSVDGNEILVLREDMTFTYEYLLGWQYLHSNGTWKQEDGNIILNSIEHDEIGVRSNQLSTNEFSDSTVISMKWNNMLDEMICLVLLNGGQYYSGELVDSLFLPSIERYEIIIGISVNAELNPIKSKDTLWSDVISARPPVQLELDIATSQFNFKDFHNKTVRFDGRKFHTLL